MSRIQEQLNSKAQNLGEAFNALDLPEGKGSARTAAMKQFLQNSFPSTKNEYWKYTDLNKFFKPGLEPSRSSEYGESTFLQSLSLDSLKGKIVFAGGEYLDAESQLPSGISIEEQSSSEGLDLEAATSFDLLSIAFLGKKWTLKVSKSYTDTAPILIYHKPLSNNESKAKLAFESVWLDVQADPGAQVNFIELVDQTAAQSSVLNQRLNIDLKANANVEFLRVIQTPEGSQYIGESEVSQARDACFTVTTMTVGGDLVRQSYIVNQNGENAQSECNGLYLAEKSEHVDHRVVLNHLKPNGFSRQLYKGVLKDKSRTVFNGKIYIEKQAQKIDSNQLNTNLILSQFAEADSKPELEVYADDVKANHGSAIGRLDKDQLFYLMSRSLSKAEATQLLAKGFVKDVSLHVRSSQLRSFANAFIEETFADFQKSIEESGE